MSFPPQFLEELRARVAVSEVVGKRVRLVRKGREFLGICPFHNDTKPSMSVVDEKGFYHCFACGAHGDVITFVRETEGLSFVEAVEKLAGLGGLEVPRATPQDREREVRRKTLADAVEAACKWYEEQLRGPEGREGLDYLRRRGLSDATITRYRLGWAPEKGNQLKAAMVVRGIDEDLLIEAGLLRRSERDGSLFDYFRGRVLFPITDRRGRPIAFGGRVLGDGQPKYLNSPDTTLFHKGRVLYGLAQAREAATKAERLIVVEGYMDVIALAEGGFPYAVAPLGTALTEDQITECWKLAPEPTLCFDGDAAGQRAAARAAERALPILKPGHSLRFVGLPEGEDPDDVIRRRGAPEMERLLDAAEPLADCLWRVEQSAQPLTTPERLADFHRRVRDHVTAIADRTVQDSYRDFIERRIREAREAGRGGARGDWVRRGAWRNGRFEPPRFVPRQSAAARARGPDTLDRRREEALLATLITHPSLIDEFAESLGLLSFSDPGLDGLRLRLLETADSGLDGEGLARHLNGSGHGAVVGGVLGSGVRGHAGFANASAPTEDARRGIRELIARLGKPQLEAQLAEAQRMVAEAFDEGAWRRLAALQAALAEINSGAWLEETD